MYTESHVARNSADQITRFQDYRAQSPVYHGKKDVFDEDQDAFNAAARLLEAKTKQGEARKSRLVGKSGEFLEIVVKARKYKWSDERIAAELERFLRLAPGAQVGGMEPQYARKPNVISDVYIPAAKKAAIEAKKRAEEAGRRAAEKWDDAMESIGDFFGP